MKGKVIIGAVCAAVILGGSFAVVAAKDDSNTSSEREFISMEEAEPIALKEVNGVVESIDLETKMGKSYYEVEIEKDRMDYDIYIDAVTGEPYAINQDDDRFDDDYYEDDDNHYTGKENGVKTTGEVISEKEAIGIAEKAVNGKVVEIELEHDDGLLEYQFELRTDRGEVEVEINAHTGEIIEMEFDD